MIKDLFKKPETNNRKLTRFNTFRRGGIKAKAFQFMIQRKMEEIDDKIVQNIEKLIAEEDAKKEKLNHLPVIPSKHKSQVKKQVEKDLKKYLDIESEEGGEIELEKTRIKERLNISKALMDMKKKKYSADLGSKSSARISDVRSSVNTIETPRNTGVTIRKSLSEYIAVGKLKLNVKTN